MNRVFTVVIALLISILTTIVGLFAGDGPLRVLILPGRWFIKRFNFEGGPPEEGVLYGLTFNVIAVSVAALILLSAMRYRFRHT